jgi:hypothetical protein
MAALALFSFGYWFAGFKRFRAGLRVLLHNGSRRGSANGSCSAQRHRVAANPACPDVHRNHLRDEEME